MCLGQGGGSLVLGDSDPKMYHGKLSYVNAAKKHYYSIMARRTRPRLATAALTATQ